MILTIFWKGFWIYRISYSCINNKLPLLSQIKVLNCICQHRSRISMYYTDTYERHLQARLSELQQKKAERQAILRKKKTHAELQRMINKKLQLDEKLKLLKDIEQRRTEIINLNKHQNWSKEKENRLLHSAKVDTLEMMKKSRTVKYRSVEKKIKEQQKERRQRFINSQEKIFRSTSHSFTQDEIGEVNKAQKKLEIQIDKKAKDYRKLKFYHPEDKPKRSLKLNQNSYQTRPLSAQIIKYRRQDHCELSEELFQDLSMDVLRQSKYDQQLKLMNTRASNKKDVEQ